MNKLLFECCSREDKNIQAVLAKFVLICLLHPLAKLCNQYRHGRLEGLLLKVRTHLTGEQELRLRLRLEYLASSLRPRLRRISYQDILQIELEVTRVLRAVASSALTNLWFDTSKYTWERDKIIVENSYNLKSLVKFSSTLKTRDFDKHWYQCPNKHLYVRENGETCVTCIIEEKRLEEREENKKSQAEQLGRNNSSPSPLGENLRKHIMRAPVTDYRVRGGGRGRGRMKGRGRFRGRW